jgi:Rha family phage regulatory protein
MGRPAEDYASLLVVGKFHKSHKNVLRGIDNLSCSQEFRTANFGESSYISKQGKELSMYYITKGGFSFLVLGYNGRDAGKWEVTRYRTYGPYTFLRTLYKS